MNPLLKLTVITLTAGAAFAAQAQNYNNDQERRAQNRAEAIARHDQMARGGPDYGKPPARPMHHVAPHGKKHHHKHHPKPKHHPHKDGR